MTELNVQNLCITKDHTELVKQVSFSFRPGELVVMLGPNGAGKSLTLQHAIGLGKPDSGLATLAGENTQTLSPIARARQLSYLPQTRSLAWPTRVGDLVALGRFAHGARLGRLSPVDAGAVQSAMQACHIDQFTERKASTLSGGELARVHCARAFAAQTRLLIADEPVAALDPRHQFAVMELFKTYVENGAGALIVLHDIVLAAKYADRLIWMQNGQIIADGSVEETLSQAQLAEVYGIKARIQGRSVEIIGPL